MTAAIVRGAAVAETDRTAFTFGLRADGYDRRAELTKLELDTLLELGPVGLRRSRARGAAQRDVLWDRLALLAEPLDEARAVLHHPAHARYRRASAHAAGLVLQHCAESGRGYWGWQTDDWAGLCGSSAEAFLSARVTPTETTVRPFLVAIAYLVGSFDGFHLLGMFNRLHLAQLVFGDAAVDVSTQRVGEILDGWGYRSALSARHRLRGVLGQVMLINRSPRLADLDNDALTRLRAPHHGQLLFALQRAVASLGHCDPPIRLGHNHAPIIEGAAAAWIGWVERWYATSTLTPRVRATIRTQMAKAGRWLVAEHPEITEPSQWTRQTCAAWVAAVDRMRVGDHVQRRDCLAARVGTPISPRTKAHVLTCSRTFFHDCQEWEWFPRRFDPARALAVPRSVAALIGTDPRVISDDVWAKLLWAGLNIEPDDLPANTADTYYPMPLIRAVTPCEIMPVCRW